MDPNIAYDTITCPADQITPKITIMEDGKFSVFENNLVIFHSKSGEYVVRHDPNNSSTKITQISSHGFKDCVVSIVYDDGTCVIMYIERNGEPQKRIVLPGKDKFVSAHPVSLREIVSDQKYTEITIQVATIMNRQQFVGGASATTDQTDICEMFEIGLKRYSNSRGPRISYNYVVSESCR